ncbi:MAG: hypothetical protein JXR41_07945, partial [Bacteroidales bacterium]|nr:hypothetical protein [Bacteroidales bacterium]
MFKFPKRFCSVVLFLLPFIQADKLASQNDIRQYTKELNIKFDILETKKLDRAIKILDEADATFENANQMYDQLSVVDKKERASDEYNKAHKTLLKASELYKEAHKIIYDVFKLKADDFWKKMAKVNHRAAGMDKARYYEGKALKELNRSLIRREQVLETDRFEYALIIMNDALGLEKLAVRDEGRAVQICLDYPVEYNYGWDDDKPLEEIVSIMRDPAVNEPPE